MVRSKSLAMFDKPGKLVCREIIRTQASYLRRVEGSLEIQKDVTP